MKIPSKLVRVDIRQRICNIRIPADPEKEMQRDWEQHGERDEYFPFWLEAWPSSYGLFDYLLSNQISLDGALELGCGCGTLAQLLKGESGRIIHTDLVPSACSFVREQLKDSDSRMVFAMDMTKPCLANAPKLVLGADLFYEYGLVDMACNFVQNHLDANGVAIFADPMRPSRPLVHERIEQSGVEWKKLLWNFPLDGKPKELAIWILRPRAVPAP